MLNLNLLQRIQHCFDRRYRKMVRIDKIMIGLLFQLIGRKDIYMIIHDPFAPHEKEIPNGVIAVNLSNGYVEEFEPNLEVIVCPKANSLFRGSR